MCVHVASISSLVDVHTWSMYVQLLITGQCIDGQGIDARSKDVARNEGLLTAIKILTEKGSRLVFLYKYGTFGVRFSDIYVL